MPQLGGKSFTDRSTSGTPILQRSDTGTVNWTTGWVDTDGTTAVANGAALTFNHNLGTNDLIVQIWMAKNGNGLDARQVDAVISSASGIDFGANVTSISTTTLTVQLLENWASWNTSGNSLEGSTAGNWGTTYTHIKVVATAGSGTGSGGASKWVSGWANQFGSTSVANGATFELTHNLGTTDIVINAYVNSSASDTNAQHYPDYEVGTLNHGWSVTNMSPNTITVTLGDDGYFDVNSAGAGTYTSLAGKYLKFVILSAGGNNTGSGTGGGFIDAFTHSHSNNQANHTFPNYTTSQKVVVTGITCGDGQWPTGGPSSPVIPAGGSLTWTFNSGNVVINLSTSGVLTTSNTSSMVSETIIFVSRYA